MNKIGLFFGTETGTTRLIAKKIHKLLGDDIAAKPVNVNRTTPEEFLRYDALILGIPSYGDGALPGRSVNCIEANWEEFLQQLNEADLSGKRIALFGLGAQERYADTFASSMMPLYRVLKDYGAEMVGDWSIEGYQFKHSAAVENGRFVGLVIDQRTQGMLTMSIRPAKSFLITSRSEKIGRSSKANSKPAIARIKHCMSCSPIFPENTA